MLHDFASRSLSERKASRPIVGRGVDVNQPYLNTQVLAGLPLVNHHGNAPGAAGAKVDDLTLAREWCLSRQVRGHSPALGQVAHLIVGNAQMHADFGARQGQVEVRSGCGHVVGHWLLMFLVLWITGEIARKLCISNHVPETP